MYSIHAFTILRNLITKERCSFGSLSSIISFETYSEIADGQRKTSRGQMSPLVDSGGLSSKKDSSLAFIPMFPYSEVSSACGLQGFSSLGSKTDPILEIQYPMPWRILAERESFLENTAISGNLVNWRSILNRVITFFAPEYRQND